MRQVFISYARDDRARVEALAERLRRLVDGVWFDSQLHGGEDWWTGILQRIRECDIFLAVVSPSSLDSEACRIEREYAAAVHRTILPVALSAVPPALPSDVATLQIVDFSKPGEQSLADLARALLAAPDAESLPDPLPPDPDAPLSYLTDLVDLVTSSRELTKSEQMEILLRLERGLESSDHDEREGARQVLQRMRNRDDLAASVERTIDLLARDQVPTVAAPPPDEPTEPPQAPTPSPKPPAAAAAAGAALAPSTAPLEPEPRPQRPPPAIPDEPEEPGHQRGESPRRAAAIAAVALAAIAATAAIGWALSRDTGPQLPIPTEEPSLTTETNTVEPNTVEPNVEPPPSDPYSSRCIPRPVESYPGKVQPFATAATYPDDRIVRWACLLHEQGVIGNYESNFTGNYGGELPPRVQEEQRSLGYPPPQATGTLDQQFYDCLVFGTCPTQQPSPSPTTPAPTPAPTTPTSEPTTETADTL